VIKQTNNLNHAKYRPSDERYISLDSTVSAVVSLEDAGDSVGVLARYQFSPLEYYRANLYPTVDGVGSKIRLSKYQESWESLAEVSMALMVNTGYAVSLNVQQVGAEAVLTMIVDGVVVATYTDSSPLEEGFPGLYCDDDTEDTAGECVFSEFYFAGDTADVENDISCAACGPNSYSSGDDAERCLLKTICVAGEVNTGHSNNSAGACAACGGDKYSPLAVTTAVCKDRTLCGAGQRATVGSLSANEERTCEDCEGGTFSAVGNNPTTTCNACGTGEVSSPRASTCSSCPTYYTHNPGHTACIGDSSVDGDDDGIASFEDSCPEHSAHNDCHVNNSELVEISSQVQAPRTRTGAFANGEYAWYKVVVPNMNQTQDQLSRGEIEVKFTSGGANYKLVSFVEWDNSAQAGVNSGCPGDETVSVTNYGTANSKCDWQGATWTVAGTNRFTYGDAYTNRGYGSNPGPTSGADCGNALDCYKGANAITFKAEGQGWIGNGDNTGQVNRVNDWFFVRVSADPANPPSNNGQSCGDTYTISFDMYDMPFQAADWVAVTGVDFNGQDISDGTYPDVSQASDCAKKCADKTNCTHFTFNLDNRNCFTKKGDPATNEGPCAHCESGVMRGVVY
jgi:hypothetical protein